MKRSQKKPRLNTIQLSTLRSALARHYYEVCCDGSTTKALVARGYIDRIGDCFYLTKSGVERAKKKADIEVPRDGYPNDPTLMQDLPTEAA